MCIHSNRTHICMKSKTGIQLPRCAYPFKHCRQHLCHLLLKLWLTGKQWIIGNHLANHMFMHDNWQVWQQIIHSPYNSTCNGSMEALITKMTLYCLSTADSTNISQLLSSFHAFRAVTFFVRWQEGYPGCKRKHIITLAVAQWRHWVKALLKWLYIVCLLLSALV